MTAVERDRATAAEKARQIDIDKALVEDLESVRGNLIMDRDLKRADTNYGDAFRKAGLDIDVTGAQEAGRWVASRTEPVELAGYLDYWAFVRRQSGRPEADWQQPGGRSAGRRFRPMAQRAAIEARERRR